MTTDDDDDATQQVKMMSVVVVGKVSYIFVSFSSIRRLIVIEIQHLQVQGSAQVYLKRKRAAN